jgi:Uma2 family endonuclease
MATKTLISLEQYNALPETENGVEYELSEGELIVLASPTLFHNRIRDDLLVRFRLFLGQHLELGEITSETDFQLGPKTVRRPDLSFISAAKLKSLDPRKKLVFPPDLAIEIASPDDNLRRRVQDYLAVGMRVWALYPDAHVARIHRSGKQAVVLDADVGDRLEDPELLPGLKIPLGEIFG